MLMSVLAGVLGCSGAVRPVEPARSLPAVPIAPAITPFQSMSESLTAPPASPVVPAIQSIPESRPASPPAGQAAVVSFAPQAVVRPARFEQTGIASWYGPQFHGKRTASGEICNQHALTAAHRSLPLGTRVKVSNVESGQTVTVRINDRGPFAGNRIIDLSLAAAKRLGVYTPGTALVRVEVLSAPTPRLAVLYAVQVGSYTDADKAAALKQALTPHFPSVYISPFSSERFRYYQVRLGPFAERAQAERQARSAARAGLQSIVVEEDDRWAEW